MSDSAKTTCFSNFNNFYSITHCRCHRSSNKKSPARPGLQQLIFFSSDLRVTQEPPCLIRPPILNQDCVSYDRLKAQLRRLPLYVKEKIANYVHLNSNPTSTVLILLLDRLSRRTVRCTQLRRKK